MRCVDGWMDRPRERWLGIRSCARVRDWLSVECFLSPTYSDLGNPLLTLMLGEGG